MPKSKSFLQRIENTFTAGYNLLAKVTDNDWAVLRNHADLLDRFSPQELDTLINDVVEYRGRPPTVIENIRNQFQTCISASRVTHTQAFTQLTLGKQLSEAARLPAGDAKKEAEQALQTDLETVLKAATPGQQAVDAVVADMTHLVEFIKDKKARYVPAMIPDYVAELKRRGQEALTQQLTDAKEALKTELDKPEVIAHLNTLFAPDPAPLDTLKKELFNTLETQHKTAVEAFEKSFEENNKKLAQEAKEDQAELLFLKLLLNDQDNQAQYNNIRAMCRKMAAEQDQTAPTGITLSTKQGDKIPLVHGVLDRLAKESGGKLSLTTKYGTPYTYDPVEKSVSIELPPRYHLSYWDGSDDGLAHDLNEVAMALKAQGHESVTLSISHNALDIEAESAEDRNRNKESLRMIVARKAYDACLLQGFKPDKIKIKINGDEFDKTKLFYNASATSKVIQQRANEWQDIRDKIEDKYKNTQRMKARITAGRPPETPPTATPAGTPSVGPSGGTP